MAAKNFSGQACLIVASLLTDKHDDILRRNIVKLMLEFKDIQSSVFNMPPFATQKEAY